MAQATRAGDDHASAQANAAKHIRAGDRIAGQGRIPRAIQRSEIWQRLRDFLAHLVKRGG